MGSINKEFALKEAHKAGVIPDPDDLKAIGLNPTDLDVSKLESVAEKVKFYFRTNKFHVSEYRLALLNALQTTETDDVRWCQSTDGKLYTKTPNGQIVCFDIATDKTGLQFALYEVSGDFSFAEKSGRVNVNPTKDQVQLVAHGMDIDVVFGEYKAKYRTEQTYRM